MNTRRLILLATLVGAVVAGATPAVAGPATWTSTVASQADGTTPALDAVSCSTTSDCVAVGDVADSGGNRTAAVDAASDVGSVAAPTGTWTVTASPAPAGTTSSTLRAVSCPTTDFCAAVGQATDGTGTHLLAAVDAAGTWSATVLPDPVGAVANQYNDAMTLSGISCWAPGACVAVGATPGGTEHLAVVETLANGVWTQAATPRARFAQLFSVSCPRPGRCVAVGSGSATHGTARDALLVETLRDGTWTRQKLNNHRDDAYSSLDGVSCTSPGRCVAVGGTGFLAGDLAEYGTWTIFAETLGAKGWIGKRLHASAYGSYLAPWAIDCPAAGHCMAVGSSQFESPESDAAAEHLTVGKWVPSTDLSPSGAGGQPLTGVACPSKSQCVAVGGDYQPMTAVWHTG